VQIQSGRLSAVRASNKTVWLFVEIAFEDGTSGVGEATLNGRETLVAEHAKAFFAGANGLKVVDVDAFVATLSYDTLAQSAFSSALGQALWDGRARAANCSLSHLLASHTGTAPREALGLYANINRKTADRSSAGHAASARTAGAAGFDAIKIAPFDEVSPDQTRSQMRAAMAPGLARIAAVREAIGPAARLMVDCHWRFDATGAAELLEEVVDFDLYWLECPIIESVSVVGTLKGLRRRANTLGLRLAGLETAILYDGFRPYVEAGAYDVMMPDVKYCGGPGEMLHIARNFKKYGVEFSAHNPSGPVAHAVSVHVCAAAVATDLLEHQFDETPVFAALVDANANANANANAAAPGMVRVDPDAPGIGITLDREAVSQYSVEL
jgi:galactonate dehydratase